MIHLPNPLTKDSAAHAHLFFVIVLSEQYVSSALWGVVQGELQVMKTSENHAWQDDDTCVNAIDQSLQELGKESENVSQTLFALPSDWVDAEGIVAPKKSLFQKMTKDLSLEPIGFVVTTEAMTQYLTRTSPQLNIFVVEVGVPYITVALVKAGQISQTIKVGRSGDSVSDFREALAHIPHASLPAKIELYSPALSQDELNEVQQQLIGFDWKATYPFLHPPLIEVFEELSFTEVVIKTGGQALATARGLLATETSSASTPHSTTMTNSPVMATKGDSNVQPVSAAEMGFTQAPVANLVTPVQKEAEPELAVDLPSQSRPLPPKKMTLPIKEPLFDDQEEGLPIPRQSPMTFVRNHLKYMMIGVIAGLLILFIGGFVAAQTLLRANVMVGLRNQTVSKEIKLTLDPQIAASDPDQLRLKATVVTQTEEGEKTADTTGKKIIGDKAKGTVTLYNYTSSQKTFAAGTKLTTGQFNFTLDGAATVASASSSLDSSNNMITKPGTQDAAMSAAAIGEDSNLVANQDFTIDNFSKETYKAINTTALSGGSSREIQAVSAQDREQLLANLRKELLDKAAQDAKATTAAGQYQVPTNRVKVVSSTFNAEVGKETASLTLQLTLQVELLEYKASDLEPLAVELLTKEVPAGYQLTDAEPQILSAPVTTATTSARVGLETNLSALAEPQINLDQLKSQLAGKSQTEAIQILTSNPAIAEAEIQFTPKILGALFRRLPSQVSHIQMSQK